MSSTDSSTPDEPVAYAAPAFAPNLLPLHPELLARAVAVLRHVAAGHIGRAVECEASLAADALAQAGRADARRGAPLREAA